MLRRRLSWADLLKRVFAIDVLQCPKCPGRMEVLAHLTEPATVRRVLRHLGIPTQLPPLPSGEVEPIIGSVVEEEHAYPTGEDFPIDPEYVEEPGEEWGIVWSGGTSPTAVDARWAPGDPASPEGCGSATMSRRHMALEASPSGAMRWWWLPEQAQAPPGSG